MVVFDVPREPEADRGAKIASIEDDSFGKNDAGMRFGSRDWIANRASFNFGSALKLQGHPQSQLQATRTFPDSFHRTVMNSPGE